MNIFTQLRSALLLVALLIPALISAQALRIASFPSDGYGGASEMIPFNGKLFFSAYDPQNGRELWCTDGTAAGTYLVVDLVPGPGSGIGGYFETTAKVFDGYLYFRGQDSLHGSELWRTDGTAGGTSLFADLAPGTTSSGVGQFTVVDSLMFFTTYVSSMSLWRTDGSVSGTFSIKSFQIASNLSAWKGKLYFAGDDNNNGQELWKSNGTANGTVLLKDLNGVVGASLPCNFHATPSVLYFMANTNSGWELWKTTGSNASTVQVIDLNPGSNDGLINSYKDAYMNNIGDTLFFKGRSSNGPFQLFMTDGTASGTVQLSSFANTLDDNSYFPVVNGKVLVAGFYDSQWWGWDSQTGVGGYTNYPVMYTIFGWTGRYLFYDSLYFFCGNDSLFGQELWRSDGSVAGTAKLQETHLLNNWSANQTLGFNHIYGIMGNQLLFSLARDRYIAEQALFSIDIADTTTLQPPSVSVVVPVSASGTAHVVWNRVQNADDYQLQYRKVQDTVWVQHTVSETYKVLNNLDTTASYVIRMRSRSNLLPSAWSDTSTFDFVFTTQDYDLDMLAERAEDSTTIRLYWMTSSVFSQVQFRYQVYGNATTQTTIGYNGFKRITGLQPGTFYAYTYRVFDGFSWGPWYPGSFYFQTPGSNVTTAEEEIGVSVNPLEIFPNPVQSQLVIHQLPAAKWSYRILNEEGKMMMQGCMTENGLDVSSLISGWYLLYIESDQGRFAGKFIRQ